MNQLAATTIGSSPQPTTSRRGPTGWTWGRLFLSGLALWVVTVLVTFATKNSNLVPTIILLGSFLVPVTFVMYAFSRADAIMTAQRIFTAFVIGGVLGVLGASLLEAEFLRTTSTFAYLWVGLIEEAVKLAALWLIAWRLPSYTMRNGIVLGVSVGLGFAAFESAGYAFNALFTSSGLSLFDVVETEVLRGILTPLGHGVWTGILGGTLFAAAARYGKLRPTPALFGWYLVVALLHALWDSSRRLAVWLTLLITSTPLQWLTIESGRSPTVTAAQVHTFTILTWAFMAMDAVLGLLLLSRRWQHAAKIDQPQPTIVPRWGWGG